MISSGNRSRTISHFRSFLWIGGGLSLAVGIIGLALPHVDGYSRRLVAELATFSRLRRIIALQKRYAAAHSDSGFACQMPILKTIERKAVPADAFLTRGEGSGYRFSLSCSTDASRGGLHYQVTAVPVARFTAGGPAFCADEAGVLWSEASGSATNCLASRSAL